MFLNIFKKKKSSIISDIIKQQDKIYREREKLAYLESKICFSFPEEMKNIRKDVAFKQHEADKANILYQMFLINAKYELKKRGE